MLVRPLSPRMMRHLLRLAVLALLLSLVPTASAFVTANTADSCCESSGPEPEPAGCASEHGGDCDCPLGCAPCCSTSARAVATAAVGDLEVATVGRRTPLLHATSSPASGVSRDILHVPKRAA